MALFTSSDAARRLLCFFLAGAEQDRSPSQAHIMLRLGLLPVSSYTNLITLTINGTRLT